MGLFGFRFVFSKCKACSDGLRSGHWLSHLKAFHFFALRSSWVAFCGTFWAIIHLFVEEQWYQFCSMWLSRKYCSVHFRIHPPTSISSLIINKHHWPSSIDIYAHATSMSDRWCGVDHEPFIFFSTLFSFCHSATWSKECSRTGQALIFSNLAFLILSVTWFGSWGKLSLFTMDIKVYTIGGFCDVKTTTKKNHYTKIN